MLEEIELFDIECENCGAPMRVSQWYIDRDSVLCDECFANEMKELQQSPLFKLTDIGKKATDHYDE